MRNHRMGLFYTLCIIPINSYPFHIVVIMLYSALLGNIYHKAVILSMLVLFPQGRQPFLLSLLSLYKVFCPELVTLSISSRIKVCTWPVQLMLILLLLQYAKTFTSKAPAGLCVFCFLTEWVQKSQYALEISADCCPEEERFPGCRQHQPGLRN